jgi:hypothetical protein
MCSFVTKHNYHRYLKFCGSMHLAYWLQKCPPNAVLENLAVRLTGLTRPHVTMAAQDIHIRFRDLRDHLRPVTRTADETVGCLTKAFLHKLSESLREPHRPHQGLDLTAGQRRNRLQWANAHLLVCFSRMNPSFNCPGQIAFCGRAILWCQHCELSAPWWRLSYV